MKPTALVRRKKRATPRRHKFTVRLMGAELERLRWDCWARDMGRCCVCGRRLYYEARFAGDPLAYDMAHIKSRGAGGSDTLENVRTLCHEDHMKEHAGIRPKER